MAFPTRADRSTKTTCACQGANPNTPPPRPCSDGRRAADIGQWSASGLAFALEEANQAGGVLGRNVTLIALNDNYPQGRPGRPNRGVSPTSQLLEDQSITEPIPGGGDVGHCEIHGKFDHKRKKPPQVFSSAGSPWLLFLPPPPEGSGQKPVSRSEKINHPSPSPGVG